ncbi:hypothetical protein [Hymenobacter sp. BT770]|uniref:hypothetical protein n=1 Tax=Hymenobacter sp. BT770 TaxID=2886942 RepID=UPI001D12FFB9|nr:hypothetical protein [Hymenobacter sp. BT770]MCC3152126.1 hypothetical protein [Hymenobacter sp. BT770]
MPLDHAAETRPDRLSRGYSANVHVDSVLAEVLVEGPASMLRVVRISATHYLVRRVGQPVLDLSERKYLHIGRYGALEVINGNNYQAQLELYFGDCPAAIRELPRAEFTSAGLAAVVQAFNATCAPTGGPARSWLTQTEPRRNRAAHLGVMASGRYLLYSPDDGSRWLGPTGGIYGEVLLPNRTVSLYGDLNLGRVGGRGGSVQTGSTPGTTVVGGVVYNYSIPVYSDFTYQAWLVAARVGVRRYFPLLHEQQFFLSGGFASDVIAGRRFTLPAGAMATPSSRNFDNIGLPLPYVGVGWRSRRVAVGLDGLVLDRLYDLRLGVSYRLGSNPDAAPRKQAAGPR